MITNDELAQIRAFAEKAMPGPYVAQDDRGWHTPCIGRITSDGYTLMRGLTCTIGKYESEMEQADFWAALWPQRVIAMIDEIMQNRPPASRHWPACLIHSGGECSCNR